jgi:hypothetical protein
MNVIRAVALKFKITPTWLKYTCAERAAATAVGDGGERGVAGDGVTWLGKGRE